jgi:O-methyltransferase involved in polyketide biosynthesis
MQEGRASRTAEHNALFRALESCRPQRARLFDDPFDHRWPGVRTSVVARTRLIDDAISRSLGGGIEQFVVLGAGFDSRAYRLRVLAARAMRGHEFYRVALARVEGSALPRAAGRRVGRSVGSVA